MAADRARSAVVRSASGQRNQSDVQVRLEQSHPLGRLWDIDVICPQNGLVGRQSLGESQRRCLLCDEPAHACARSRRHDTDLVVARVEQMIDAWFARD
ncbi:phosphoribosyl-dephospho-CoA transferase [Klebsiella pneumoniae]|uniref:Apo-citrate lyase phosphoribosyl-dephospho-CoA transferase n=1 Tax=Klebsiella pneumoniae TaxID=573 RepID=A0A4P0XTT4_KLEPN|nr:phosphoribosyl-dephospho-CoA transferase [Klebsiella pneumoniae]